MEDLQRKFNEIPPVTKWLCTSTFVLTLAGNFGMISPMNLLLFWNPLVQGFEVWRIITCYLFAGKLGFPFVINLIFLFRHSSQLESLEFRQRSADYLYFILVTCAILAIFGLYFSIPLLSAGLNAAVIYYWSKCFADIEVSFFFGLKFRGQYLPWMLLAFNIVMGDVPITQLLGILASHLFYFFKVTYPATLRDRNPSQPSWAESFLDTPWFIKALFAPAIPEGPRPREGVGRRLGE